jgi:hypothetical protein
MENTFKKLTVPMGEAELVQVKGFLNKCEVERTGALWEWEPSAPDDSAREQ